MKSFLLLAFAFSGTALAQLNCGNFYTYSSLGYNWGTDQLSASTTVCSGNYYYQYGESYSGTFDLDFYGLNLINSPDFFIRLPIDYYFNQWYTFDEGQGCFDSTCYFKYGQFMQTYIDMPLLGPFTASQLEPLVLPVSISEYALAEDTADGRGTIATTTVTVDFGDLIIYAGQQDVTKLVSFIVRPTSGFIPEPATFALAGVGLLLLAARRIRPSSRTR